LGGRPGPTLYSTPLSVAEGRLLFSFNIFCPQFLIFV
jgi:hypothetical protein